MALAGDAYIHGLITVQIGRWNRRFQSGAHHVTNAGSSSVARKHMVASV